MLAVVAKIISKIILERLKQQLYSVIDAEQAGFCPGSSCTDHINTIRILIEQCVEHRADLSVVFIDSIHRNCIWTTLRNRAVPEKIICIIRANYEAAKCRVLHKNKLSESFEVRSGVHKGALFNSSWGRFARGSQTSPSFRNQTEHDKFSTASGLCGQYLPFRT